MQSLLLVRAAQPLSLTPERSRCRQDRHQRVHATLEEEAENYERAGRGLRVGAAADIECEYDYEVHEREANEGKSEHWAPG